MDDKIDRFFCDTFHDLRNCNSIRGQGHYSKNTFLLTNSNDNILERSVPIVDTLCNKEDEFSGRDEFSKQVDIPCQNASRLDQQNQYDGIESAKPSINSEFDNFGKRRGNYMNHIWDISLQWGSIVKDTYQQPEYSDGESKQNFSTQMVRYESSNRIWSLSLQLGPLLRVNSLDVIAQVKKKPCHFILQNNRLKTWNNENDTSLCQVFPSNENDEEHGYRFNLPILIDTIMKPNRCYIANSLGIEIHDKDQEDYISYIKEEFGSYIDDAIDYGFDHIIIIGELNCGMLFLDCFGHVFILDSMTNVLLFYGDYFKGVERVTKGLELECTTWIIDSDEGNIIEVGNGPRHYLIPFEKKKMKEIQMKEKKKKSLRKKRSRKKQH